MARADAPLTHRRLAAVGVVVLTALAACSGGDPGTPRPTASAAARHVSSYRVVYRVAAGSTTSTEAVEVVRPYRSRRLQLDGSAVRGGAIVTDAGIYTLTQGGSARLVGRVAPGEAGSDLRLATTLAAAEAHGLARRDGTGRVADRGCTWWLTKEPLDTAAAQAASADDVTRSCVDDAGLLLADTWRSGGSDVRARTATEVVEHADLTDPFIPGQPQLPLPAQLDTTLVEAVPGDRHTGGWLAGIAPPPGLRLDRTARVEEVDLGGLTPALLRETRRTVFTDGTELVVADEVHLLTGPFDPLAPSAAVTVDLGAGRPAFLRCLPGGLVVEALLAPDRLLRVRASLPEAALLDWLRAELRR